MAASLEQSIAVKIRAFVAGLSDVKELSGAVNKVNRADGKGLRAFGKDVDSYSSSAKNANLRSAELTTGFTKLSKTITGGNALGGFVKDLKSAAKELKAAEVSSRALANSPFEQGLRASGGKVLSLAQAARDLRKNEILPASSAPSKALSDGLAKADPFQNQSVSLAKAARELKLYEAEAARTAKTVSNFSFGIRDTTKSFLGFTATGSGAASVLLSIGAAASVVVAALAAIGAGVAAFGFAKFVAEGIRFNASIESARIGLASLVSTTQDITDAAGKPVEGMDAFRAASALAETEVKKIQKAAIETAFEFEDILKTVNNAVAAGAGANLNLSQTISLVTGLSRAASAINLSPEKFNTQVKQILSGATTLRTDLARVLFAGQDTRQINDQLKEFRKSGTLFDELNKKLRIFQLTANDVANTFSALSSNVSDAFSQFAADSTVALFDRLKDILRLVIDQIIDFKSETVKLTPAFDKIAIVLNDILGFVGDKLLEAVKSVFAIIADGADYLYANREAVEDIINAVFVIVEQLFGIGGSLLSILGSTAEATDESVSWAKALQYVALFFGLVRDLLDIIIGSIKTVASLLLFGVGATLDFLNRTVGAIVENVGLLIGLLDEATFKQRELARQQAFNPLYNGAGSLLLNGIEQTTGGFKGTSLFDAADDLGKKFTRSTRKPNSSGDFNFKPRQNAGDSEASKAADKARREREKQLAGVRTFLDALADFQISYYSTVVDAEKDANDLIIDSLKRRYDLGLISTEEFYKEQERLRNLNFAAEERLLKRQLEVEKQKASRTIGTIFDRETTSDEAFKYLDDRLADSLPSFDGTPAVNPIDPSNVKEVKALTEYTKYLDRANEIQAQITKNQTERTKSTRETTTEIEKQNRLLKQQAVDINAQTLSAFERDGEAEILNLQKRLSDELPKILTETNAKSDGLVSAAKAIGDAGATDIASLAGIFKNAGIEVESLSAETRGYIKLLERLTFLAANKQLTFDAGKIQSNLEQDTTAIQDQVDRGIISRGTGRDQIFAAQTKAADALKQKLADLRALIADLESKGAVTDTETRIAAALANVIETLPTRGIFETLTDEADEAFSRLDLKRAAIARNFRDDKISELDLRNQTLAVENQEKIVIEGLIAQMARLPQLTTAQKQAIAELRGEVANLGVATDTFGASINEQIGGGISTFLDDLVDRPGEVLQSFQRMVSGILLGIAKVILQAVVLTAILSALGIKPGGGGIGGAISKYLGIAPEKKAAGGIISGAGTSVSDSIPALLSNGEAIIPTHSVKAYGRSMIQSIIDGTFLPRARFATGGFADGLGVGAPGGNTVNKTRILNILDPSLVKDYLSSSDGESVILNVIARNGKSVNQMLVGV